MKKQRSSKVGLSHTPSQRLYMRPTRRKSVSEAHPLSRFRQVTHLPNLLTSRVYRVLKKPIARVSSVSGAHRLSLKLSQAVSDTAFARAVCRARKIRRQVLFAKKKQGGNHKPSVFRLSSLIRCK